MSVRCCSDVIRGLPGTACVLLLVMAFVCSTRSAVGVVPENGGRSSASQPSGRGDSKSPRPRLVGLIAGWKGTITPGPPGPWRLEISCGDKPVDAIVTMSFRQDSTQKTEISQRVALVPGRVARIEFAAAIAERDSEIEFVLRDSAGRKLDGAQADTNTFGNARFTYELPYYHFDSAVLFVGRRINPPAATDNRAYKPIDEAQRHDVRSRCLFKVIEPVDLPTDPASYGGVSGVVLDQADLLGLDPARLAALREYLATGGNVSLITSIAGDGWQLLAGLVPLSVSGPPVVGVATPVVLADAVQMSAAKLVSLMAGAPSAGAAAGKSVAGDARVLVRSAELTTLGRDEGWVVWPSESTPATDFSERPELGRGAKAGQAAGVGPVLARGPIGLGQLTVWLVSPTLLGPSVELAEIESIWNTALLAAGLAPADPRRSIAERSWYSERGEAQSLTSARRDLTDVMPKLSLSHTLAWIFGGVMLALATVVGVGDAKMHRRDKRPRAYFTCAAWIVLACVLAVVLPRILGNKAAFVLRVSASEQVCQSAAPLSRSVVAHAILADQATDWMPPVTGSFCQGFDLLEPQFARHSERFAVPTIELATIASASGVVTRPLTPLSVRRSAIHCMLETQVGKPTFTPATTTDAQGRPTVRLAGLRPGDQIVSASLLFSAAVVQAEDATADAAGTATLKVTVPAASASADGVGTAAPAAWAEAGRLTTTDPLKVSRAAQLARAAGGRYVIVQFRVRSPSAKADSSTIIDETSVTLHVPVTSWPEAVSTALTREAKAILYLEPSGLLDWKRGLLSSNGADAGSAPATSSPPAPPALPALPALTPAKTPATSSEPPDALPEASEALEDGASPSPSSQHQQPAVAPRSDSMHDVPQECTI